MTPVKDDVMLVITRKPDQAVVIGDEIQLTIIEVLSIGVLVEVQATPETRVEWKTKEGRRRHRWSNEDASFYMVLDRRGRISFDRTVHVTLIDIRTEKARLGVEAPRDIPVHRKEIHESTGRE
jgi:carbon storage regulator CsrA